MRYTVDMHLVRNKYNHIGKKIRKIYESVLLMESYREGGKVKKRTIANLSACSEAEINAIEMALKNKHDVDALGSIRGVVDVEEDKSIGAVFLLKQMAERLGITKALGTNRSGKLALWQVIARVLDQGSRLSAVRLAKSQAAELIVEKEDFTEDDLYDNLAFLSENQDQIERRLFKEREVKTSSTLFLYDVTSSYLEGDQNYFAQYGYNRDKKKGKLQIVIGLLCDETGAPVSVEVFDGNTQDPKTFGNQVQKAAQRFGCHSVTMVGDKGMIKQTQINDLPEGFHYITTITKAQIEGLIQTGTFQMELFTNDLVEIQEKEVRYILRRNPQRVQEMQANRESKRDTIIKRINKKNDYLNNHPRAKMEVAKKEIDETIKKLKLESWCLVEIADRKLHLKEDSDAMRHDARYDGCYVIKTDLPAEIVKDTIHNRYKDLAKVEQAFRSMKTNYLEVRPVFVRKESSTRGHVLIVMLAYLLIWRLRQLWENLDTTVEEGLDQLKTLCAIKVSVKGQGQSLKIPKPRKFSCELLTAANISLPATINLPAINVDTKVKLQDRR